MQKNKSLIKSSGNIFRTEEEKQEMISEAANHYGRFLEALGFNWKEDDGMKDTPIRVARSWVKDLVSGCMSEEPSVTEFENTERYGGMIVETGIEVSSICSHHNLPFYGVAAIGYIPSEYGKVIGLSKLNRVVEWFSRRPQIQEGLTKQIHKYLDWKIKDNKGIIVHLKCTHGCVRCRGVRNKDAKMITVVPSGFFVSDEGGCKTEFISYL